MNVVIRTDASELIGTGHLVRCLTLADYLSREGASVTFVCRDHPGDLCKTVEARGHNLGRLPAPEIVDGPPEPDDYQAWLAVPWQQDADQTAAVIGSLGEAPDWVVVDHYGLDEKWESHLRDRTGRILVIDDLADRSHNCDILLDQNFSGDTSDRYRSLIPTGCRCLLGPRYALLRAEFSKARDPERASGRARRIFVFLGGVDRSNITALAIVALAALPNQDYEAQVVAGRSNVHRRQLAKTCSGLSNIIYCEQVDDMAVRMAAADLAIGAAGTTTWERCAVGLPSLVISVAENQLPIAREVERLGVGKYLGSAEEVTVARIMDAIERLWEDREMLSNMRQKALDLVDGRGVERVSLILQEWVGSDGR